MSFTRSTLTPLILTVILVFVPACSDDDPPAGKTDSGVVDAAPDAAVDTTISCGTGTSGSLAAGGSVTVSGAAAKDLAGAGVSAPSGATTVSVTIACEKDDLVPAGFTPLGPAVSFSPGGNTQPVDLRFTLPFKPSRLPVGAGSGSVVVFWKRTSGTARGLMLVDPNVDNTRGTVSFDLDELDQVDVASAQFVEHQPPAVGSRTARLHHAPAGSNPPHPWPGGGRELLPVAQHGLKHHARTEGILRQIPRRVLVSPRPRGHAEQAAQGLQGGPVRRGCGHHRVVPQRPGDGLGQAGLARTGGAGEDDMTASLEFSEQLGRELARQGEALVQRLKHTIQGLPLVGDIQGPVPFHLDHGAG